MGLFIHSLYRRQSRTKANTYVPTYIVGKKSRQKSPSQQNFAHFSTWWAVSKAQNDTFWTFYLGWELLGMPSGSVWTQLSFPVRLLLAFGFSNAKKFPIHWYLFIQVRVWYHYPWKSSQDYAKRQCVDKTDWSLPVIFLMAFRSKMHISMTFPNTLVFLCIIVGRKITSHLVSAYPWHLLKKERYIKIWMAFGSQIDRSMGYNFPAQCTHWHSIIQARVGCILQKKDTITSSTFDFNWWLLISTLMPCGITQTTGLVFIQIILGIITVGIAVRGKVFLWFQNCQTSQTKQST